MPSELPAPRGRRIDRLGGPSRADSADERAAQEALRLLVDELGYPAAAVRRSEGGRIEVWPSKRAASAGAAPLLVGRAVARAEGEPADALAALLEEVSAEGAFLWAGEGDAALHVARRHAGGPVPWPARAAPGRAGGDIGAGRRGELRPPGDLKRLLRRCHTRLHALGAGSDEADLALDLVRLLVTRFLDERDGSGPLVVRCAPAEWATAEGRAVAAARTRAAFAAVQAAHPEVFPATDRITLDDRAVCAVAAALQEVRLVPAHPADEAWDLLGLAYEELTAAATKRRRGQFFTNRLVVDLAVGLVDPRAGESILDPAGGGGGFLTGALRALRRQGAAPGPLHLLDVSPRLTRIARAALLLQGATAQVCRVDSLGPAAELPAGCPLGGVDVVLTNPPFAGTGDGRRSDRDTLRRFLTGHRWAGEGEELQPTDDLLPEGAPPELLFFERCLRWLAPGGRLGIVVPKSVLDTRTHLPIRTLLLREFQVLAVVTLHPHTFQPHTGVRTALVVVRRRLPDDPPDPPLFMALSRAAGQDSEGRPVLARDPTGGWTGELDEDLTDILAAWRAARAGTLTPTEYRFTVARDRIDPLTRSLSPQAYRPGLNATLSAIAALEDDPEYTVSALQELTPGVLVYKGPRLRTDDLLVPADRAGEPGIEPYYTPGAVLAGRADAAKWLDPRRASPRQAAAIARVRVRQGDLVLTRSGTIGRVALISSRFDGAIVSDDLIRVRVPDERARLYLWAWLESKAAQDQLLLSEYGAIQQHLEPEHVRALLVALPRDAARVDAVVAARRAMAEAREAHIAASQRSRERVSELLTDILDDP